MSDVLLPCKCGSPAEIDWSGCSEIAGNCWQTASVRCTNPGRYTCYRAVTVEVDGDEDDGREAEQAAIATWNQLRAPVFKTEQRVIWTSRFGNEFSGVVRHRNPPKPATYYIELDDGTEVESAAATTLVAESA